MLHPEMFDKEMLTSAIKSIEDIEDKELKLDLYSSLFKALCLGIKPDCENKLFNMLIKAWVNTINEYSIDNNIKEINK